MWEPITRVKGSTEVRPHGRDAALRVVYAQLSRAPPQEWAEAFSYSPGGVTLGDGMQLEGARVSVWAEPNRLEAAVAQIDKRIALANRSYERNVLPALRAEDERRRSAERAAADRLAAERARVKDL